MRWRPIAATRWAEVEVGGRVILLKRTFRACIWVNEVAPSRTSEMVSRTELRRGQSAREPPLDSSVSIPKQVTHWRLRSFALPGRSARRLNSSSRPKSATRKGLPLFSPNHHRSGDPTDCVQVAHRRLQPMSSDLPGTGTRISHSGSIGTVRYVGPVDGTNGVWLGVEWDDPKRGKHDGVKDGRRYFSCL